MVASQNVVLFTKRQAAVCSALPEETFMAGLNNLVVIYNVCRCYIAKYSWDALRHSFRTSNDAIEQESRSQRQALAADSPSHCRLCASTANTESTEITAQTDYMRVCLCFKLSEQPIDSNASFATSSGIARWKNSLACFLLLHRFFFVNSSTLPSSPALPALGAIVVFNEFWLQLAGV